MSGPVVVCTDGSDASIRALEAGLAILAPAVVIDVVTVIDLPDDMLVSGTGMAGGVMSAEEFDQVNKERADAAQAVLRDTVGALGLAGAEAHVIEGTAGPALCDYAEKVSATALVLGTRGRGGFTRAVLGSVADHVSRNATCPVVITGHEG